MQDICTYHIEVQGQVDEKTFNAASPIQVVMVRGNTNVTLFEVRADQSGLIGLLRYLHQQGFVLLSVFRK